MQRKGLFPAIITGLFLYLTGAAPLAQAVEAKGLRVTDPDQIRLDTPSGLPVPRMVSLKSGKTYCRTGPSFEHPIELTFMRKGLPVMVIAETTDYWRKIRDLEGDECWTHKSTLSGAETALVLRDGLVLHARPQANAPARARLGRGVIAYIEDARNGWLKVSADGVKGWASVEAFWGAKAAAPIAIANAATHN
ncbi:SH3 domain-containing protein [Hyphococcus flavus]|uniref:SH3 domain-containing protein n=1 Tax=Hyphococcus flavus TaxID=1866326 RepID=A0AAE9ZD00_9PROT|nr:SH3 domain-containing protein [Hyphococcus flavus]WDI32634.1 SH3 domain-containing protein [Hyphococcus flavus]